MFSTKRIKFLVIVMGLVSVGVSASEPEQAELLKYSVAGRADKDGAIYNPGEEMIFTIRAMYAGRPTSEYYLKWIRTADDGKKVEGFAKVFAEKALEITTSLDVPGFVRIQAFLADEKGKPLFRKQPNLNYKTMISFDGGAGVEIEKLKGVPEPQDFDAFWKSQKAKLAKVPLKAGKVRISVDHSDPALETYVVTITCAGAKPATGYLKIPTGAKEKSLPINVYFHGYGIDKPRPLQYAGGIDMISFTVNAHGMELEREQAYYDALKNGKLKNYAFDNQENIDAEMTYFNGMVLRLMRALEYVKSLPQWDGKNLTVQGGSQGGFQALIAAGVDSDISRCSVFIPWCCDLGGITLGRLRGWRPDYHAALDYYDPINHAKRINCPVEIQWAGLGDYTCPPSGIAVLYNNIRTPKSITFVQGATHCHVPPEAQRFILKIENTMNK